MSQLDDARKKLRNRCIIFITIIAITLFFTFYVIINYKNFEWINLKIFAIIAVLTLFIEEIYMFINTIKLNVDYIRIFKNVIVLPLLKESFTNLYFDYYKGINSQVLYANDRIRIGNNYHSSNYISGEYKNVKFEQADVHIQVLHRRRYVTVFQGRWIIFDLNKNIESSFQIVQKGFSCFKWNNKESVFKKIKIELPKSIKNIAIFAQDEFTASYLITPTLLEEIEKIIKNSNGKSKYIFYFTNNKLHVGIDNRKNSFEPISFFRKLNIDKINKDVYNDIHLITQLVDELSFIKE